METIRQMLVSAETQVILNLGTIIAVVIGLIKILSIYNDIKNKVDIHDEKIKENTKKIESIDGENNLIKTTQAVLETKLENIEVRTAEILTILKDK